MYDDLGARWASSIPAFIALACFPFPILFYKYGAKIRLKCRFSAEALRFVDSMKSNAERQRGRKPEKAQGLEAGVVEGMKKSSNGV